MKTYRVINALLAILTSVHFLLALEAPLLAATRSDVIEVAITVDDLPSAASISARGTRMDVANKILMALKKHRIKGVYGFANGFRLDGKPEMAAILKRWKDEGHFLGNHTFSHPNLNQTELNSYLDNIAKNELFLSQYFSKEIFSWFRFPFLGEGETTEKRMAVRQYLKDKGYKTAQVTIDFWDWAWNDTFARCFDKGDKFTIDWLRRSYLDLAEDRLYFSVEQARILFNRPIKHILLVHFGEFDALMMESLLGRYKQLGVRFIDFKTAMQDKVYENDPDILKFEGTFLSQHMQKSNIKFPPYLRVPMDMLEHACR